MLKRSDFIRQFHVALKTDRDCESPMLIDFIKQRAPLGSLLDIGAHWSGQHYAPTIRTMVDRYVGIDIQPPDDTTRKILDAYHTGNANDFNFGETFDAVICVSTIEHAGVSTYKGDHVKERMRLFETCLRLAKKHVWISFPVGQEYVFAGELAVVTEDHLESFEIMAKDWKVKERFFHSQGPQAGHQWYQHAKRDFALKSQYVDYIGNCNIGVMEIDR